MLRLLDSLLRKKKVYLLITDTLKGQSFPRRLITK